MALVIPGDTLKNGAFNIIARITGQDREPITIQSMSEISFEVHETVSPFLETKDKTILVIADVVFNDLRNDADWTLDDVGYNFLFEVPGSAILSTNNHQIDVRFVPVTGNVFFASFNTIPEDTFFDG